MSRFEMVDQDDRILRINAVLDRTGLTRATLYRKIADGSFPPQVRLNPRCVGWRESSVRRWIAAPYGYSAENDNDARDGRAGHGEG
jgi:prophage regulatory protein